MKIRIVGCDGGMMPGKLTTCFQVTESLFIDAGSIASGMDLNEQRKIRDIFISHTHIDHIKDLAFLADNLLGETETITIHALPEVNKGLKKHFFNNAVWPDFTKLPSPKNPFYKLNDIEAEKEYAFGAVKIFPIEVTHSVLSLGFVLKNAESSLVISGDTGPTERLWEISKDLQNLRGFIVEVAFPISQQVIADGAKHFTPRTLKNELPKFERDKLPIALYHLKPRFAEEIQKEIKAIANPSFKFLHNGEVFQF